jgi:hypothetical protein
MRAAPARRSAIKIVNVVLTALVLAALAPARANASCSHYVRTNSDLPKYELIFAPFDNARPQIETTEPFAPLGPLSRRPCSGALCSGQPASSSTSMQIDVPRAGQWAIIATLVQVAVLDQVSAPSEENVRIPSHCSTSVYHPPRTSRPFRAV